MFVHDLATLVRVRGSAVVGVIGDDIVEHDSVSLGADGFVLIGLECEACLAILAILGELSEAGPSFALLVPPKPDAVLLRVCLHAFLSVRHLVLLRLEPAEMSDLALEILGANVSTLAIGLADGLKWPLISVVAVEALDAVAVSVASIVLFEADTDFLAVAGFALTGHSTAATRIQV